MIIFNKFGPSARKWHPVTVRTEEDVDRLNELFRKGWYLQGLELDGLPCLAFSVPLAGTYPPRDSMIATPDNEEPEVLVLMLSRTSVRELQRARLIRRDEHGYIPLSEIHRVERGEEGWDAMISLPMENGCHLLILERTA